MNILLILHLLGAVGTGFFIVQAIAALLKKETATYKRGALNIGVSSCYALITGSMLMLTSPTVEPLWQVCQKFGLYTSLVFMTEGMLYYQMQIEARKLFPIKIVSSTLLFGLMIVAVSIFRIYG